jgi:hypothetical protein
MAITLDGTSGVTTPGVVNTAAETIATTLAVTGVSTLTGGAVVQGLTVGRGAGAVSTNTVVGNGALNANTTGQDVTAIGYQAYRNGTASYQTAIGFGAMSTGVITGTQSVAVGRYALNSLTSGNDNVAVGDSALTRNTSGGSNVAIGRDALAFNLSASNNTAVGYQAGYTNTTAQFSTFIGAASGYATTGERNTFVGQGSGTTNSSGTYNTFLGQYSGGDMTTGSKNSILGRYNGNQNSLDIRTASNYIVLSDGDGNPRGVFDSSGNLLVGSPLNGGQTGVGIFTQTAASDCLTANATNASFTSAIVNIRTTRNTTDGTFKAIQYYNDGATAQKFYVIDSGAIYSTSTTITSISDQRFKENIKDIDVGLDAVMALKPRRFDWIDGKGEDRKNAVGFIAQEMQTVLPDLISIYEQSPEDTTEYLAIRQSDLIPTLVKAIQELKAEFDAYKASHP